jgi:hypothetical protein
MSYIRIYFCIYDSITYVQLFELQNLISHIKKKCRNATSYNFIIQKIISKIHNAAVTPTRLFHAPRLQSVQSTAASHADQPCKSRKTRVTKTTIAGEKMMFRLETRFFSISMQHVSKSASLRGNDKHF